MAAPAPARREAIRTIGYLSGGADPAEISALLAAYGHVEGRNLRWEVRIVPAGSSGLDAAAEELVRLRPQALLAFSAERVGALRKATREIPIVCGFVGDAVLAGFAKSHRRPGYNVTGLSYDYAAAADLHIALVRKVLPGIRRIVGLTQDRFAAAGNIGGIPSAAERAGFAFDTAVVSSAADAARVVRESRPGSAVFLFRIDSEALAKAAIQSALDLRVPVFSGVKDVPRMGALLAFGREYSNAAERIALLLDKVLRGANPAEIPFEEPDRTYLVINRQTARALGIEVPPDVLLRATELVG